jgi:hypothetical protein
MEALLAGQRVAPATKPHQWRWLDPDGVLRDADGERSLILATVTYVVVEVKSAPVQP